MACNSSLIKGISNIRDYVSSVSRKSECRFDIYLVEIEYQLHDDFCNKGRKFKIVHRFVDASMKSEFIFYSDTSNWSKDPMNFFEFMEIFRNNI